jgi:hypothetical protein
MLSTTVKSVMDVQRKRLERESGLKNKIVTNIKERIKNYAKHGQMRCIFQVPSFIFGHPPYDISEMTLYIVNKLDKEGFYIKVYPTSYILISWDVNDIRKHQKEKEKERKKIDDLIPLMSR